MIRLSGVSPNEPMVKPMKPAEIDARAEQLLVRIFGSLGSVRLPVDMNKVASICNLTIRQGDFADDDVEGALDRSKRVIFLDRNISPADKRFVAAHEVAHLNLHDNVNTDLFHRSLLDHPGQNDREDQANQFAAALLIPRKPLEMFWKTNKDIDILAHIFGVSENIMRSRLERLKLL